MELIFLTLENILEIHCDKIQFFLNFTTLSKTGRIVIDAELFL